MIKLETILHIIPISKFTKGYIEYFIDNEKAHNKKHLFIVIGRNRLFNDDIPINKHIIICDSYIYIYKHKNIIQKSSKIIVSSFFSEANKLLLIFSLKQWNKTHIQFWGGDIYRFKKRKLSLKEKIDKLCVKNCIKKSKSVLTLTDGDYDVLESVFKVRKKHKTLLVPDDFYTLNHIDYESLKENKNQDCFSILIGNSATPENQHKEVFDILNAKKLNNVELIVPLSYGLSKYKNEIVQLGKMMFGDKFVPVTQYMQRDEYIRMLSRCDVAIFNNNRQQATGNITILINLNKKIYMRSDTTMWQYFNDLGLVVHDVKELENSTIEEILYVDKKDIENNKNVIIKMEKEATNAWKEFLNE